MNRTFSTGGGVSRSSWRYRSGIIGLYLRHALEETPAFQQHVDTMEQGDREGLQDGPKVSFKEIATKHWRSLLPCIGLVISTNVTYYMLLTYMPS